MVMWITCVLISHVSTSNTGTSKRCLGFDLPKTSQAAQALDNSCTPLSLSNSATLQPHTHEAVEQQYPIHTTETIGGVASGTVDSTVKSDNDSTLLRQSTKRKRSQSGLKVAPKNSRRKTVLVEPHRTNPVMASKLSSVPLPVPSLQAPCIEEWKPNTTYLMCPTVLQITPPVGARVAATEDVTPLISFFIPPDCLSGNHADAPNAQVLQVTCQVVDLNLLPVKD